MLVAVIRRVTSVLLCPDLCPLGCSQSISRAGKLSGNCASSPLQLYGLNLADLIHALLNQKRF